LAYYLNNQLVKLALAFFDLCVRACRSPPIGFLFRDRIALVFEQHVYHFIFILSERDNGRQESRWRWGVPDELGVAVPGLRDIVPW
jgi:hypothetical protein